MRNSTINCPQCGGELPLKFRHAKMATCSWCGSTIFLEDDAVKLAGKKSVLAENPSLLSLGTPFLYRKLNFTPVGHIRYAYENGEWDEWWAINNAGEGFWLSVDEGDFAFERPIELSELPPAYDRLTLGQTLSLHGTNWQVTEKDAGVCVGFQGELPEQIDPGERLPYVHLSAAGAKLLTLEYWQNNVTAYLGEWVDPFDIKQAL